MQIFYFEADRLDFLGSTNQRKIIAMAKGKPVHSCAACDYHGQLLNAEWVGEYPSVEVRVRDFDIGRYGL